MKEADEKTVRDMKGNLWSENGLLEKAAIEVDEYHFYCVNCKEVHPVTIAGGLRGSIEIGGYACNSSYSK